MTGPASFDLRQHDSRAAWPVPAGSVHLVCGSPPYFKADRAVVYDCYTYPSTLAGWAEDLAAVARQAYLALADGGRLVVNVANTDRKPYLDLAGLVGETLAAAGFTLRGHIIWDKGPGVLGTGWGSWQLASAPSLRDQHEYLIVGQKGARLAVAGYAPRVFAPKDFESLTASLWRVNPASKTRDGHPAPWPLELARRLVRLYTAPGMTVLDPWAGCGATCEAALLEGCQAVGYDLSAAYLELARVRTARATSEDLCPS